ncbi:hypothetical protein TanjilG_32079 [Lupinus angustifolius]|uniref:NAB domain-containing protein n=2 Tax=Lupinus angustifolius TaxID=3871 RepID=A0A4P1RF97_LUPAN|nr:hypothetical protein TanjilG_32079 [Lupinus angustifolius]
MTKIMKLIQNEEQSKEVRNLTHSREETELVGLIEDLYNHYQSLYAMYDGLYGELGKLVSRRRSRRLSMSFSDSDSEYFSPEEVEGNNLRSETYEVLNSEASNEAKKFEEKLTSNMKEIENLSQQKRNLELQVENQAQEVKQLSEKNEELELLLKEKYSAVSILRAKLKNNENQANSNIEELMAQINKLELDAKYLQTQKDEMEEKCKCDENESLAQRKDLMNQLNVMQQNLDSICKQNKELEALMEKKREETSQYSIQIENLKENLAEMSSVEQIRLEEKETFLARIKDLELELETRTNEKNEGEEQLRDITYEIKQLEDENKALQDRNNELKGAMIQSSDDISAFLKEHDGDKNGASMQIMDLKQEVNVLRLELDWLHEQKNKLEQQNERSVKEHAESLAKMENLNLKLSSQIADQAATIERISAEHKQEKILSNKFKLNRQSIERKIEELAQEFRRKMEDNIRLLHQRIHVAEQLNNENKNSCKMTKQRYEQENKLLGEKVTSYEEELRMLKMSATHSPVSPQNRFLDLEALHGLELFVQKGFDFATDKVDEHKDYVMSSVSKMMSEVMFMKDWIKRRNDEMKKLMENANGLNMLLNSKEEQELLLREKVWELEAKVSKEGGDKLNLAKAVSQLEKKVVKLEKNLKEKDEELISLGEKKREAIRQLCFMVDFHRDRCSYLRNLVIEPRKANNRT